MSLKDRLKSAVNHIPDREGLFERFGLLENPFPSAAQSLNNPHLPGLIDDAIEQRISAYVRDRRSHVVVIEGTQGVGKTNLLSHYEKELHEALSSLSGFYVIRYLADPEPSFDGILRRLFQELGESHLVRLGQALADRSDRESVIDLARSYELRVALHRLARDHEKPDTSSVLLEWLLGARVLNRHKETLGVKFRLDTVESRTLAFRDLVMCSSGAGILTGIFLLLDELEKQDGVLSPTLVVRYLSAVRAIIDALPNHLFMMIAVTPDAMRRYSFALPAFRSRLEDRLVLEPLKEPNAAVELAAFYLKEAKERAERETGESSPAALRPILGAEQFRAIFQEQLQMAEKRRDPGVRQREFLHRLHIEAEKRFQAV